MGAHSYMPLHLSETISPRRERHESLTFRLAPPVAKAHSIRKYWRPQRQMVGWPSAAKRKLIFAYG